MTDGWYDQTREQDRALESLLRRRQSIALAAERLLAASRSSRAAEGVAIVELQDRLRNLERLRIADVVDAVVTLGCDPGDVATAAGIPMATVIDLVRAETVRPVRARAS